MFNYQMETAEPEVIVAMQTQRLRKQVLHAYTCAPYYRAKMDELGVVPEDIRTLDDIRKLPFTSKQDMRDNYPYGMLAVPLDQIVRLHCSSGTTGKPTVVAYTKQDLDIWTELLARTLTAGGLAKGSVFQVAVHYGLFTGGMGFHYAAERVGAAVLPASSGNTARQIMLMKDFGVTNMVVTPSYALHLAESIKDSGCSLEEMKLQSIFCGAEMWSDQMHRQVEAAFGVKAYDVYGLSEIIGPGVSCECEAQDGLHLQEDHFYAEVIDPVSGEVLPEGEIGELVLTTLTKEGMPMLRYRTRDITALYRDDCPCGRRQLKMKRVTGRTDDMLIIRGVNVFPSQIESVLLEGRETAPHYEIQVDREGPLDHLTVCVENSLIQQGQESRVVERRIGERLKSVLGVTAAVRLVAPRTLPRSEGKAKRVIDRRFVS